MNQVRTHAAANAKALAMFGKLLDKKAYQEIIDMESVEEIFTYLKTRTHYSAVLAGVEKPIDSYEIIMKRYFLCAYEKLSHFYFDAYKDFFKSLFLRYEVENLKLFARALFRQEDLTDINEHLIFSKHASSMDFLKISKARTMQELIDALEGTRYHKPLVPILQEESHRMLFHMEMILDQLYFNRLFETISALNRDDKASMMELLGMNIDVLNLQWIFRGRKYFEISSEELFHLTLSHGKKYPFKKLKALCYMDMEEYRELILMDDYGELFQEREYMLERAMERYLFYKVKRLIQKAEISISAPVGLLFMFEYEVRDLFTIMEAKKYRFENIEELLIRDLRRE